MLRKGADSPQSDIRAVTDPYTQSAFSKGHVLRRLVWNVAYTLFFRPTPRPFHTWRAFVLRCFGAKLGRNARVYNTAVIWAPWNLIMEDDTSIAEGVICYSMAQITLKEKAIVSQRCSLCTGTHDYTSKTFQLYALPITIGERSWVCAEAFIGPGVRIGGNSVVSAGAVIMKTVPNNSLASGNPATVRPKT